MKGSDTIENKYFEERMAQLGITDQWNTIAIQQTDIKNAQKTILVPERIFRPHEKGIEIMVYDLERLFISYTPENARWKKKWSIIRLENPITKEDGSVMKYQMPKGAGSFPFFPPGLVDKFEKKEKIESLFLTEGFFKAFKGYMHGMDIVGLPSITHLMEKTKGSLHPDVLRLINTCNVSRVVWLTDGDCLDISGSLKQSDGKLKDLYRRPANFFNSIQKFKQLLDDYDVDKYFMHIDTENIEGKPKGLDDLLIAFPNRTAEIVADLTSVSKASQYAQRFNITAGGITKVRNYFHLGDVTDFYLFHSDRRKDLKDTEFVWNGTQYKFDEKENRCIVVVPGDSKNYFRVGDYYYKYVMIPNQHKKLERIFVERKKTTIMDDHNKNFIQHIPKYEIFCNVPEHVNYQQTVNNCFNVYSPLDFFPDEEECTAEDCPTIIAFVDHIFGHSKCKAIIEGQQFETTMFEMGLDYLQLLYQQPAEKLPILCLVSKENNTGKSTLGNFLRLMLGANVAIVGNQDLAGDFNSHWATKCVVVLDEAKIDKQHVVEKVKMLSTAKKIMINSKGKAHAEIDCFIKFVMITNNEDNFITVGEEDIRFWVLKIPKLKTDRPNIMDDFIEELPAFLSFLSHRKLATSKQGRMWFHPRLIETEALNKVREGSRYNQEKELRLFLKDVFLDFGIDKLYMTRQDIQKECFKGRLDANYLEKLLKQHLKAEQFWRPDPTNLVDGEPGKKYVTCRYNYPRWEESIDHVTLKKTVKRVEVSGVGRPYVFKREDYLSEDELRMNDLDVEAVFQSAMATAPKPVGNSDDQPDDVPF
ncbi:hypothetical protein SAMN05444008_11537 [Cnuella takakiae]|uniref:NrS-1 polymerase-like helicase domain-containing protein n=1 Tax=Cnuella takakiae TaxID=1302690 RepID=A0A1M5FZK8_9BACT|nr:primase-helicase family protein [Cnuella takakiae]OLY92273.1 hypothetical protein BUE76_10505 [Cnuella takakiae]SHF96918.1 hypothetical protein SAMN05444008_11537 [Cnuella takakiae]